MSPSKMRDLWPIVLGNLNERELMPLRCVSRGFRALVAAQFRNRSRDLETHIRFMRFVRGGPPDIHIASGEGYVYAEGMLVVFEMNKTVWIYEYINGTWMITRTYNPVHAVIKSDAGVLISHNDGTTVYQRGHVFECSEKLSGISRGNYYQKYDEPWTWYIFNKRFELATPDCLTVAAHCGGAILRRDDRTYVVHQPSGRLSVSTGVAALSNAAGLQIWHL